MAAAAKVQKLGGGVWGHNVPLSNKDFTWYFLYHGLHNRGVDIISKDQSKVTFNTPQAAAALQFYADLITNKVQPPVGQYDREAGVSLFKAGRIAFVHDEPLSPRGLPRGEAPVQVGTSSTPWVQAGSARSSRRRGTGSWPRRARTRMPHGSSSSSSPRTRSRARSASTTAGHPSAATSTRPKTPRRARLTRRSSASTRTSSRAGTGCPRARRWPSSPTSTARRSRPRPPARCRSRPRLAKAQKDGTAVLKS